jgi:hypothetical protein
MRKKAGSREPGTRTGLGARPGGNHMLQTPRSKFRRNFIPQSGTNTKLRAVVAGRIGKPEVQAATMPLDGECVPLGGMEFTHGLVFPARMCSARGRAEPQPGRTCNCRSSAGLGVGSRRRAAECFGDAPFRGLKPHNYPRTVAPRQEKLGTSRPRCKFLKYFLTGNRCVRICRLPLAMARRVDESIRGVFDIGRAEARRRGVETLEGWKC